MKTNETDPLPEAEQARIEAAADDAYNDAYRAHWQKHRTRTSSEIRDRERCARAAADATIAREAAAYRAAHPAEDCGQAGCVREKGHPGSVDGSGCSEPPAGAPEPLTPGERRAFLAGVSAADEDREFDEPAPTLDVCEALRTVVVLLNHASKAMIVAGLAEDGVSVTEANMTILNVLAKLSRKDSAS